VNVLEAPEKFFGPTLYVPSNSSIPPPVEGNKLNA
jgi:hypothetical protein